MERLQTVISRRIKLMKENIRTGQLNLVNKVYVQDGCLEFIHIRKPFWLRTFVKCHQLVHLGGYGTCIFILEMDKQSAVDNNNQVDRPSICSSEGCFCSWGRDLFSPKPSQDFTWAFMLLLPSLWLWLLMTYVRMYLFRAGKEWWLLPPCSNPTSNTWWSLWSHVQHPCRCKGRSHIITGSSPCS